MNDSKHWLIASRGTQQGPFTEAEVRNLVEHGKVGADSHIWTEGFSEWKPILSVFPLANATPPPVPAGAPAPPMPPIYPQQPASPAGAAPPKKRKNSCLIGCGIILGCLLLLAMCGKLMEDRERSTRRVTAAPSSGSSTSSPSAASDSATQSAATDKDAPLELPPDQHTFLGMISSYAEAYKGQNNELKKSQMKNTRDAALRQSGLANPTNWKGTLASFGTNSDGKAYVSVALPSGGSITYRGPDGKDYTAPVADVEIKTWNNGLSDIGSDTLIAQGTPVFNALSDLEKGDPVVFSAVFLPDEKNVVEIGNLTENGKMTSPEFIVRFTSIQRGQ